MPAVRALPAAGSGLFAAQWRRSSRQAGNVPGAGIRRTGFDRCAPPAAQACASATAARRRSGRPARTPAALPAPCPSPDRYPTPVGKPSRQSRPFPARSGLPSSPKPCSCSTYASLPGHVPPVKRCTPPHPNGSDTQKQPDPHYTPADPAGIKTFLPAQSWRGEQRINKNYLIPKIHSLPLQPYWDIGGLRVKYGLTQVNPAGGTVSRPPHPAAGGQVKQAGENRLSPIPRCRWALSAAAVG